MTRQDALVSTGWLAEHLDDPAVRVIDATYLLPDTGRNARAEFEGRHIPGAVFFDLDAIADPSTTLPHMLPTPERFAAMVGALGLGNGRRIIAYDTYGLMSAARAWWMFQAFGHDDVAVLDGGLPKWLAEGRPTESGPATPAATVFTPRFRPELVRTVEQVLEGGETLVDARAAGRFEGTAPETWPGRRSGHIPGSLNLPYTDLIDPAAKTVLAPDAIRDRFAAAGVEPGTAFVASCGSGITACVLALGRHLTGDPEVAVYDGSWAEWGLRQDLPLETGPARK